MAVACCVSTGLVFGEFLAESRPVDFLFWPTLVAVALAVLVGSLASLFGRASVLVSAFGTAWVISPESPVAIGLAAVMAVLVIHRLATGRFADVRMPVSVAAAVFMAVGVAQVVPLVSWSSPAQASTQVEGPPTYLVLLDGYPRADTLADRGVDISPFITQLEARGFDHYPGATSYHHWTFRTLTVMTSGEPMKSDTWGDAAERGAARASWSLPAGFVYIAPPFGWATIPDVPTLNPGGTNAFEERMLRKSLLAPMAGDYLMDGLRRELDRSLTILGETNQDRVFAHIFAPHDPYLFKGSSPVETPACWPDCSLFDLPVPRAEVARPKGEYLQWLNQRLITTVDQILVKHPAAEIVLFSDHGGRFPDDPDEWHRTFLSARTPARPHLFGASPHPRSLLPLLGLVSQAEENAQPGSGS